MSGSAAPTQRDLERIKTWAYLGEKRFTDLPVGSYFIQNGRVCYKDRQPTGSFSAAYLELAKKMAEAVVTHIDPHGKDFT